MIKKLKKAWRSRTIKVGVLVTVLSAFQGIYYQFPLPWWGQALAGSGLGILIIFLRLITKDAIDEK